MNIEIPPAVQILANKLANAEALCAVLFERLAATERERDALKMKIEASTSDA